MKTLYEYRKAEAEYAKIAGQTVKVLPGETLEEEGERRMEPETAKAVMLPPSTRIKDKTAMIICCNFFFMYETFS